MTRALFTAVICASLMGAASLTGCSSSKTPQSSLAAEIDSACGGADWRSRDAFSATVKVSRATRPDIQGVLFYDIHGNRLVVQFLTTSGATASCRYNGQTLWVRCPVDSICEDWPTLLRWLSWVAVPYRLTEPSLDLRETRPIFVQGKTYRVVIVQRPQAGNGICAVFINQGTLLPSGIVPVCPANVRPGAMPVSNGLAYEKFGVCDDMLVPTQWSVWRWQPGNGVTGSAAIGTISLQDVRFVFPDPLIFEAPIGEAVKLNSGASHPAAHRRRVKEASNEMR
jgi:hypothetical protein